MFSIYVIIMCVYVYMYICRDMCSPYKFLKIRLHAIFEFSEMLACTPLESWKWN